MLKQVTLLSLLISAVLSAPLSTTTESAKGKGQVKLDLPVAQLEKLKQSGFGPVKTAEDLVARAEDHTTADSQKPLGSHLQYDMPAQGMQKEISQEAEKPIEMDGVVPTAAPAAEDQEPTTKVFHGAARLISQASSAQHTPPPPAAPAAPPAHTAHRRSPNNADINKEFARGLEHYDPYVAVPYVPFDMANYVLSTGDEIGVTMAIEKMLQQGRMSKEEAIAFLQETKLYIDYLKSHLNSNPNMKPAEDQDLMRHILMSNEAAKENYQPYQPGSFKLSPSGGGQNIYRVVPRKDFESNSKLNQLLMPIVETHSEPMKRTQYLDPMMQTNIISTSDYDRDGPVVSEEEYEEMMEKLKAADTLYTEYTLEEIIYQLAKMMFSQSLTRDPREARASIQRFMTFLDVEADRGQLSRNIEKKVLDVMIAALTDAISDHPEQMQPQEPSAINPGNRLMRQYLENNLGETGMSRAILTAYKDELLKEHMHKLPFIKRN